MVNLHVLSAGFTLLAAVGNALPAGAGNGLAERQTTDKLVFAHFMVGIMDNRGSAADYDADMQRAKAYGIDAFALNIGTDASADTQLQFAYDSAANNGMKVFISFDFNYFSTSDSATAQQIGLKIAKFGSLAGQLMIGSKIFASSFAGTGFDADTMRAAAGAEVYWAPNFSAGSDVTKVDAALNWMGWDSNGANRAPSGGTTVTVADGDKQYTDWLAGKPYVAPVSPWFFTHFGPETAYPKNWVFPGDLLWFDRWNEILLSQPQFLEIISWNDYGESHYVGPLSSKHTDDGASKYANDMPHDGWLDLAKPYIAAYKAGASSVDSYIGSDQLIYWYRPTPQGLDCDSTDTVGAQPDGAATLTDNVFVVALLTSAGTVDVTSGVNTQSVQAPTGATAFQVPMGVGSQSFKLSRGGVTALEATSIKDVSSSCVCGIYNFNAFVGTVPASPADSLGTDGLTMFSNGLKVSCTA